jgi:hypothetical protein
MADQTAIDVYERGKYSEDHRKHRDGDPDAPKGSPIDHHDATLNRIGGSGRPCSPRGRGPIIITDWRSAWCSLLLHHQISHARHQQLN